MLELPNEIIVTILCDAGDFTRAHVCSVSIQWYECAIVASMSLSQHRDLYLSDGGSGSISLTKDERLSIAADYHLYVRHKRNICTKEIFRSCNTKIIATMKQLRTHSPKHIFHILTGLYRGGQLNYIRLMNIDKKIYNRSNMSTYMLSAAFKNGTRAVISYLIVQLLQHDISWRTHIVNALTLACSSCTIDILKYAINLLMWEYSEDELINGLLLSACKKNLAVVKYLLPRASTTNHVFVRACVFGNADIITYIYENAEINTSTCIEICRTYQRRYDAVFPVVKWLITLGAELDRRVINSEFQHACLMENTAAIDYFGAIGADWQSGFLESCKFGWDISVMHILRRFPIFYENLHEGMLLAIAANYMVVVRALNEIMLEVLRREGAGALPEYNVYVRAAAGNYPCKIKNYLISYSSATQA